MLRLGLLIGGLIIIVDLLTMLITEQTTNPDEIATWQLLDLLVNIVLFCLLGTLVVRDTGVWFAGALAGVFASLLDAIVVTAAALMVPPAQSVDALTGNFAQNLLIGAVVAGISGVVYALVQRWSDGQPKR